MALGCLIDWHRTVTAKLKFLSRSTLVLFFVVIVGVLSRIAYVNVSLWLDESWVANSVLSDSLTQMFYYPPWLQTSPPLFLLLVRYTVKMFGLSHATLRAVPILLSILSMFILALLARQFFDKKYVLLCVTLLAINPTAIHHSINLKQYSSDLFSTVILLLAMHNHLKSVNIRSYVILLLTFGVALFLSYTAVFLIPSGIYSLWRGRVSKYKLSMLPTVHLNGTARIVLFVVYVSGLSIVNYDVFIQPNTQDSLIAFWGSGFPRSDLTGFNVITFYLANFANFAGLFITRNYLDKGLTIAISLMIVAGFAKLVIMSVVQKDLRAKSVLIMVVCLPFLSLIAANLIGKYPYGVTKLNFFLLPVLLIVFVFGARGFQDIMEWLLRRDLSEILGNSIRFLCVGAAGALLYFLFLSNSVSASDIVMEDAQAAVNYLKANIGPKESLYVHASMVEQFKVYCRLLNCDNISYYYGHTAAPCCPRNANLVRDDNGYALQNGLKSFMQYKDKRRRWFLFSDRGHWRYVGRNEAELIRASLKHMGCEEAGEKRFRGVLVYAFDCN